MQDFLHCMLPAELRQDQQQQQQQDPDSKNDSVVEASKKEAEAQGSTVNVKENEAKTVAAAGAADAAAAAEAAEKANQVKAAERQRVHVGFADALESAVQQQGQEQQGKAPGPHSWYMSADSAKLSKRISVNMKFAKYNTKNAKRDLKHVKLDKAVGAKNLCWTAQKAGLTSTTTKQPLADISQILFGQLNDVPMSTLIANGDELWCCISLRCNEKGGGGRWVNLVAETEDDVMALFLGVQDIIKPEDKKTWGCLLWMRMKLKVRGMFCIGEDGVTLHLQNGTRRMMAQAASEYLRHVQGHARDEVAEREEDRGVDGGVDGGVGAQPNTFDQALSVQVPAQPQLQPELTVLTTPGSKDTSADQSAAAAAAAAAAHVTLPPPASPGSPESPATPSSPVSAGLEQALARATREHLLSEMKEGSAFSETSALFDFVKMAAASAASSAASAASAGRPRRASVIKGSRRTTNATVLSFVAEAIDDSMGRLDGAVALLASVADTCSVGLLKAAVFSCATAVQALDEALLEQGRQQMVQEQEQGELDDALGGEVGEEGQDQKGRERRRLLAESRRKVESREQRASAVSTFQDGVDRSSAEIGRLGGAMGAALAADAFGILGTWS
jgi:hypothetical protein